MTFLKRVPRAAPICQMAWQDYGTSRTVCTTLSTTRLVVAKFR